MKKAVSARGTLGGGLLLIAALTLGAAGWAGAQSPPATAAAAVNPVSPTVSPEKQKKLDEALAQGERSYKAAEFEKAVAWYQGALKLEPSREDIFDRLKNATRMRDLQAREQAKIPADPKSRQKFLDKSLEQAERDFANQQFDKAYREYNAIWLVAPADYNARPKVIQRMDEAGKKMEQAGGIKPPAEPVQAAAAAPAPIPPPAPTTAKPALAMPGLISDTQPAPTPVTPVVVAQPDTPPAAAAPPPAPVTPFGVPPSGGASPAAPAPAPTPVTPVVVAQPAPPPAAATPTPPPPPSLEQAQAQARAALASILDDPAPGAPATPAPAPVATPVILAGASKPDPAATPALGNLPPIEPVGYEPAPVQMAALAAPSAAAGPGAPIDALDRLKVTQLLHSARELNAAGKAEDARRNVNKALELWPGNTEAKALLVELNRQLGYGSRSLVDSYLAEGDALAAEGKFDQAAARYDEALKADPANADAAARKDRVLRLKVKVDGLTTIKSDKARRQDLEQLHNQAVQAYDAKDLKKAREIWQRIAQENPDYKPAQVYLENTKAEWERYSADQDARERSQNLSEAAQKLLNSPVSVSTEARVPLDQFMKILSFSTPVEMEYSITEGAKAMISGNFQNKALREVLDTVLLPIGLSWSINDKNVIVIEQKLITKTYTLSPSQMSKVKTLAASGELQRTIWEVAEPPAQGCALTVDERQNMLVATGSRLHLQRIESLLPALGEAEPQEMIMRIYKINEKDGPRIRSLINSIISATSGTPFDLERKIFIDKEDLIVRDTPENIKKIEELLLDKKFIQDMRDEKLDIANFSLIPRDTEVVSDQIRAFTSRVVEAIKVFLYSQVGESKAMEEGRRLWYDPYTLQLTIVDMPFNLARVGQYIQSLPELGSETRQDVIFLKFAIAEDLAASLENILAITGGQGLAGAGGANTETAFKMRTGDTKTWRNLRITLRRVQDPSRQTGRGGGGGGQRPPQNQGTAEFEIDNGYQNQNLSLQELSMQYIDDYRFTLEDVAGTADNSGLGSVRLRIAYVPQLQRNMMSSLQGQTLGEPNAPIDTLEDVGISINPFGELNALILRYTNPAMYKDVMDLIAQLDKPTMQVTIETKFVQVNENRAKEFSADFNIAGLGTDANGQKRQLDWDTNRFNSRFAQDSDEFRDIFSAPIENVLNTNLIKGTTVLNAIIGNQDPLLNISLRMLEAEGVLNLVNGPRVTALDGVPAEFRIERYAPDSRITATGGANNMMTFLSPLDSLTQQQIYLENFSQGGSQQGMIDTVVLICTPQITGGNSITLNPITAELIDFEGWLGEVARPTIQQQAQTQRQNQFFSIVAPPQGTVNFGENMLRARKIINTQARVDNGGTIILGGWTGERTEELTSGVPVLRNMPFIGKLLFSRNQRTTDRTSLLIFLTCYIVE